jgi:O-antigen/teichoic acid export membrane protein
VTGAGTIVGNAAFILTSDVVNRASTFVLYALIARYLGVDGVGQMALALALFHALQVFASAGLRTIVTREIARDRSALERLLARATLIASIASIVSIVTLAAIVWLAGYSGDTAWVVLLLGAGLLPYALSVVCEAVFQASQEMRYVAYAQVPVHLAKVGLAWLILVQGHGIRYVAMLLLACHATVWTVEWWLMRRYVAAPALRRESTMNVFVSEARGAVAMVRSASTFLGIDALIAIGAGLNIVLLSWLAGEKASGLYSAAIQLMVPITLIYQSAVLSTFPTLCKRFGAGSTDVTDVVERMLAVLVAVALPAAVGLFFLADSALLLLYGSREFLQAANPLRIMVWNLIPAAMVSVLGQVFLASVRERVTLRIVAVDLVVGLVAGVILIEKFGLAGAAAAAVLTKAVDFWQHYTPVSRLVPRMSLQAVAWKPLVACACMAIYLYVAPDQHLVLRVTGAGAVYLGALAVTMWTANGQRPFTTALSHMRPD